MNKEHIEIHEGKTTRILTGEPIIAIGLHREQGNFDFYVTPKANYADIMESLFSAAGIVCNQLAKPLPEETEEETLERKEKIYDWLNILASSVLQNFMPDKELRPDWTVDAMLEAEDKLIEKRYEELSEEEKESGKECVARVQANFKEDVKPVEG